MFNMITYNEIRDELLSNPKHKVAVSSASIDIPVYGASLQASNMEIWVVPSNGNAQFKLTEDYTLKILS